MLDIDNKNIKNELLEYYKENKITEILEFFAMYSTKNKYFKINYNGDIIKNKYNYVLPGLFVILKEKNIEKTKEVFEYLLKNIKKSDKKKIKKSQRLTKYSLDKIEKNFFKELSSGNAQFAIRHGNELMYRTPQTLKNQILFYALINTKELMNPYLAYSAIGILEKLKNKEDYYYVLEILLGYLANAPRDFSMYEKAYKYSQDQYKDTGLASSVFSKNEETLIEKVLEALDGKYGNKNDKYTLELYSYIYTLIYFLKKFEHKKKFCLIFIGFLLVMGSEDNEETSKVSRVLDEMEKIMLSDIKKKIKEINIK